MNQNLCEIIALLDRSGSMARVAKDMECGFDSFIREQQTQPGECQVTLVQFDTAGIETSYEAKPVAEVPPLSLKARGGTPLLDAMGDTIDRVGARLAATPEARRPGRVLFLVMTDGYENSSQRFKKEEIKGKVELQTNVYKWQFSYLGANVDAFAEAGALGIPSRASSGYQQ